MAPIISASRRSDPDLLSDAIRRKPAKAHLQGPTPRTFQLGESIWEVLVKGHGSVKAAAFTMGNTDPSLLRRQILDGTLPIKKLFEADARALATFGEFLIEHYGQARKSKAELAREKLPELLAVILEAVSERESR